jgi:hypothetical protein
MKIYVEGHFNSNMRTLMLVSKWDGIPYCELKGGRGGGRVSLNMDRIDVYSGDWILYCGCYNIIIGHFLEIVSLVVVKT